MPTGYTSAVKDGITFEQFALGCARAFGALSPMRDDPAGTPIPDEFKPTPFYADNLASAVQALSAAKRMTDEEATAQSAAAWQLAEDNRLKTIKDMTELRGRYEQMVAQVNAWTPPTTDHSELKVFMLDQLTKSIEFDCDVSYYQEPAKKMTGPEYKAAIIEAARKGVERYAEMVSEEEARAKSCTDWVKALKTSLKEVAA